MKRYQIPKSSFLYKFSMRFLLLILIPVIVGWLIFIEAMNYFYVDNLLTAQQISMEKSLSSLETSLNATSNAITAGVNRALAIVANLDAADGSVDYVDGEV